MFIQLENGTSVNDNKWLTAILARVAHIHLSQLIEQ